MCAVLFYSGLYSLLASLVAQMVKHLPAKQETQVRSLGWEDPWRKKWQSTPVFLPGKSHGWRSLVGYSPCGRKESDTISLSFLFSLLLLLLLLLSRFSRVRLCATPSMAAQQAPPSLGFSRQEHWSGLPFPSPMHEVKSKVKLLSHV